MTAQPSTARRGNPKDASRGAAVQRAKNELGDAIDDALILGKLAEVTGIPVSEMRSRLDVATIEELERWRELVKGRCQV